METETELEAEIETNRNSPRRQLKKLFKFLSLVVVGFFSSLRFFRFSLTLVFVINYFAGWRQGQREEEEKEEEQKLLLQP